MLWFLVLAICGVGEFMKFETREARKMKGENMEKK
jgi:hypothetical protein